MKHLFWWSFYLSHPTASGVVKGRAGSDISLDIQLPRLRHLAVSVPGPACDIIGCITAPMLEDLHLDGSREPDYEDRKRLDYEWAPKDKTAWKALTSRCRSVRRLAVTQAYIYHEMCGIGLCLEMMRAGRRFQCWSALRCMGYLML